MRTCGQPPVNLRPSRRAALGRLISRNVKQTRSVARVAVAWGHGTI